MKLLTRLKILWAVLSSSETKRSKKGKRILTAKDKDFITQLREEQFNNVLEKKGITKFTIDGYTVYARDTENAIRKVNNLKKKKIR